MAFGLGALAPLEGLTKSTDLLKQQQYKQILQQLALQQIRDEQQGSGVSANYLRNAPSPSPMIPQQGMGGPLPQVPNASGQMGDPGVVKGSWFGNAPGWNDPSDSGLQANGQPVSAGPGIALPSRAGLGQQFDVTAPTGQTMTLPQTDVGPAKWTGRGVDINAPAAAAMGYSPQNFPTDAQFVVRAHRQLDQAVDQLGTKLIAQGFSGPAVQDTTKTAMEAGREIPPQQWGRVSLPDMMRAIDKANPNASDHVKMLAIGQLNKLLAPTDGQMLRLYMQQHQDDIKNAFTGAGLRERERHDVAMENKPGPSQLIQLNKEGEPPSFGAFDPKARSIVPVQPPAGTTGITKPGTASGSATQQQNIKLYDALEAAQTSEEKKAAQQAIDDWNRTQGKGISGSRSAVGAMRAAFKQEHPDWTEEQVQDALLDYRRLSSIESGFGGGVLGRNVVSLNTVADHAQRVRTYFEALNNGQIPRANQIANAIAVEEGKPEVTDFETGANIMTGEVTRLLTTTGGGEGDRERMLGLLKSRFSESQGRGALNVFDDMINARFDSLRTQYAQGRPDRAEKFDKVFLGDEARKLHASTMHRQVGGATGTAAGKTDWSSMSNEELLRRAREQAAQ